MPAGAERLDADALALQVADGADGLVREQLVAAGMHAGQRRDRLAGVQMAAIQAAVASSVEVDLAACDASSIDAGSAVT